MAESQILDHVSFPSSKLSDGFPLPLGLNPIF